MQPTSSANKKRTCFAHFHQHLDKDTSNTSHISVKMYISSTFSINLAFILLPYFCQSVHYYRRMRVFFTFYMIFPCFWKIYLHPGVATTPMTDSKLRWYLPETFGKFWGHTPIAFAPGISFWYSFIHFGRILRDHPHIHNTKQTIQSGGRRGGSARRKPIQ